MNEIARTLQGAKNESTESPYWLIVDPRHLIGYLMWDDGDEKIYADLDEENVERCASYIPNCITGPYFSREDAEAHLKARHYEFSSKAYVYCFSGYWSRKYKDFWRQLAHEDKGGE